MLNKKLSIKNETTLNVHGRNVKYTEYEQTDEGDFVKVCNNEHEIGVNAEYAWIENKYPNYKFIKQAFTSIKLNDKIIKCDILTIKTDDNKILNIYFDISQMMENLNNKVNNKTNKDLWEKKAIVIYNKLKNEYNFSIYKNDEESLYKEINKNISIGFDITYFFGFILNDNLNKNEIIKEKDKCLLVLSKYFKNKFIGNKTVNDVVIGGYIKIDEINDIDIVFKNYINIEEEYLNIPEYI